PRGLADRAARPAVPRDVGRVAQAQLGRRDGGAVGQRPCALRRHARCDEGIAGPDQGHPDESEEVLQGVGVLMRSRGETQLKKAIAKKASPRGFYCTACGGESLRWFGQCPVCASWNTLVEAPEARAEKPAASERRTRWVESAAPRPLKDV